MDREEKVHNEEKKEIETLKKKLEAQENTSANMANKIAKFASSFGYTEKDYSSASDKEKIEYLERQLYAKNYECSYLNKYIYKIEDMYKQLVDKLIDRLGEVER